MIAMIKAKTGIAVDMSDAVGAGGTSTTGNTARALLFDHESVRCLLNVSHKWLGEIKTVTGLYLMNVVLISLSFESCFLKAKGHY